MRYNDNRMTEMERSLELVSVQACVYLAIIFQRVFNLVLQTEEAVRSRPAGWWINSHVQILLHLLTVDNLGTIGLNWTGEKGQ